MTIASTAAADATQMAVVVPLRCRPAVGEVRTRATASSSDEGRTRADQPLAAHSAVPPQHRARPTPAADGLPKLTSRQIEPSNTEP